MDDNLVSHLFLYLRREYCDCVRFAIYHLHHKYTLHSPPKLATAATVIFATNSVKFVKPPLKGISWFHEHLEKFPMPFTYFRFMLGEGLSIRQFYIEFGNFTI